MVALESLAQMPGVVRGTFPQNVYVFVEKLKTSSKFAREGVFVVIMLTINFP